jgi:hypothetical protein
MEERVAQRIVEAAEAQRNDPGWGAEIVPTGIRIKYTWLHENKNFYTVESFTGWGAIERARINPLLTAMDDLIKQKNRI